MMFKKVVLPTVAISAIIFAGFAMFLAQYGSERIEVRVDNQHLLYGEVRDIVSPGIGVALGLTLGVAGVAVIGYSKSANQVELLEKQLLSIEKAISDKDAQIKKLRNFENVNNVKYVNFGRR